ncbi:MAG: hypothetical protein ACPGXL_01745 [Chitinophagales bacterium]
MKKYLLLATLLICGGVKLVQATIDPESCQPLLAHLTEVNEQWDWASSFCQASQLQTTIHFNSDNERIQTHLKLVVSMLRNNLPNDLTATQLENRLSLLHTLEAYYKAGIFPINHYHNSRNPYFIDQLGTACAVGHLIIESGHGDLAQTVRANNNYAYIKELTQHYPELEEWAKQYGFQIDELALIQPGYPPNSHHWTGFGTGLDGNVRDLHYDTEEKQLIVAGDFVQANGVPCNGIAVCDADNFAALGSGVNGMIHSVIRHKGLVYAAGDLENEQGIHANIATWNGTNWVYENIENGAIFFTFHIHNDELYVGGENVVSKKHFGQWTMVGTAFSGTILDLTTWNGILVAGGNFTQVGTNTMANIAQLAGSTWQSLGNGLNNQVRTLAVLDNELYAGGDFFDVAGTPTFGLAKYTTTANTWEQLIDPTWHQPMPNQGYINDLKTYRGQLILGGHFMASTMMTQGQNVAIYQESNNSLQPIASIFDPVSKVAIMEDFLYVGGDFSFVFDEFFNEFDVNHFMFTDLAVRLQAKALLQGPYNPATQTMRTSLQEMQLLPTEQPYDVAPWNYDGKEAVSSLDDIPTNAVDWVLVELRNANDVSIIEAQRAGFLLNDGRIVEAMGGSTLNFNKGISANYHIVIRHRNHLAVMSQEAISLPNTTPLDLSLNSNLVAGGSSQLASTSDGKQAMLSGDLNSDGVITIADQNYFSAESSLFGNYYDSDCNLDHAVTIADFNFYKANSSIIGVSAIRY